MNKMTLALATVGMLALSACGQSNGDTAAAPGASASSLASAIGSDGDLSTLNKALETTGLKTVFDGKDAYTVLAPNDAAFAALGVKGKVLTKPEESAALAAALRAHILPGALVRADIGKAIDSAAKKEVTMRTLGNGTVTFKREGDAITVTSPDGATARLLDEEISGSNGSALVIDKVLIPA